MRMTTRLMLATAMLGAAGGAVRAQDVVDASGTRRVVVKAPVLGMGVNTAARPTFMCTAADGCALNAVVVLWTFEMPEEYAILDSADQAAHVADIMRRTDESWRFIVVTDTDTTEFTFISDSVQFTYGYDPRHDFGKALPQFAAGPRMFGRAEITDPTFLAALRRGRELRVLWTNLSTRYRVEQHMWLPHANLWLRRLQDSERKLAAAQPARAGDPRNGAAAPR